MKLQSFNYEELPQEFFFFQDGKILYKFPYFSLSKVFPIPYSGGSSFLYIAIWIAFQPSTWMAADPSLDTCPIAILLVVVEQVACCRGTLQGSLCHQYGRLSQYSVLNGEVIGVLFGSFLLPLLQCHYFLPQPLTLWPWWFVSNLPRSVCFGWTTFLSFTDWTILIVLGLI